MDRRPGQHRRPVRAIITLLSLATVVVLMAACGSSSPAAAAKHTKTVTITLAGSAGAGILPAFAAQQEGFFARNGLNVNIKTVTDPSTLVAGLGHQFQLIETYATTVISAAASGISIAAVAGGEITSPSVLITQTIVKTSSGITSWRQLQGKTVGSPTVNGLIPVGLLALIKQLGGDPKSVHLVQVPFTSEKAQLDSGRVNAILIALPYYASILAGGGYRSLGDPDLALAGPSDHESVLGSLYAAQRTWATKNRKILSEYIAGISDADKWIAANPGKAKEIYVKISGLSSSVVQNSPLPKYKATVADSDVAPWVAYMKSAGQLSGTVNSQDLVIP